ncbi:hypothetical protein AB1Y20_023695 [Prymnesium parvum]|uniref:RING-type E3 ubiquitin transferase n=1 Tax=Prymnesium parvum TaxID=97485 RepID=A0AB34JH36_PRYPA
MLRAKRQRSSHSHLVQCPCCGRHVHRLLINDHLESCRPPSPARRDAPCVECPACGQSLASEAELDVHLDAQCPSSTATRAASPLEGACPSRATRPPAEPPDFSPLGDELKCPICMDLFEAPHSLPCQHSFCRECIMESFRLRSKMQCPICNTPTWRRELKPNHLLEGIVTAFKQVAPS